MRLITRYWQLKLLSVFLSMTTWAVVVYAGNPPQAEVLKSITIEHGPLPATLSLLQQLPAATVTVVGLTSSINNFKRESLRVSVDVHNVHLGDNVLQVHVDNSDRNVTVRQVMPSTVTAHVDTLFSATKKVDVRLLGKADTCCQAATPVATPDSVTLAGPRSLVETAVPFVAVDITGQRAPVDATLPLKLEDPDHKVVSGVTATPSQVAIHVPIDLNKVRSAVPLVVDTTGQPPAGYHITAIDILPVTVLVDGQQSAISNLDSIHTETIDVSTFINDIVRDVRLKPVNGINVITSAPYSVHIHIQADQRVEPTPTPAASPSPSASPR